MKFGVTLPNNWGVEDVQAIISLAKRADELGFSTITVADHLFNVSYVLERIGDRPYYDPMTTLTYIAAVTSKVGLLTSVLVLPYHNPIRLAKVAATLDVMSGGRLRLGVGVGVIEQELEVMGCSMAERGAMSDEAIAVMKALWTQEEPVFEGKYYHLTGMKFSPKPLQKPHLPLCIGGNSRAAIRRAARIGNAWHPTSRTPETLAREMRYLGEQAEANGRDPAEIPVSVRASVGTPRDPRFTSGRAEASGGDYSVGYQPEEIVQNIRPFQDLGVEEVVLSSNTADTDQIMAMMEMVARDVMPAF